MQHVNLEILVCCITCGLTLTFGNYYRFHLLFVSYVYHLMYFRCIMLEHVTIELCVSLLVCCFIQASLFRAYGQQKNMGKWVLLYFNLELISIKTYLFIEKLKSHNFNYRSLMQHVNLEKFCRLHNMWPDINLQKGF